MFNMTGSEVMFLLIIGLVVLGPEKLPEAIRRMGKLYAELKRMSSGVQTDFRKVMDEPIKEMMSTTNSMKSLFTDTAGEFQSAAKEIVEPTFIPYNDGSNISKAQDSLQSATGQQAKDASDATASTAQVEQQRREDPSKHSEVIRMEYNDDELDVTSETQVAQEAPEPTINNLPAKKSATKKAPTKKTITKKKPAKKKPTEKTLAKKSVTKKKQTNGN